MSTTNITTILFPFGNISSSNFNASTGIYTIPTTGVYTFTVGVGFDYQFNTGNNVSFTLNLQLYQNSTSNIVENCVFDNTLYLTRNVNYHINLSLTYSAEILAGQQFSARLGFPVVTNSSFVYINANAQDTYFQVTTYN